MSIDYHNIIHRYDGLSGALTIYIYTILFEYIYVKRAVTMRVYMY